MNPKIKKPKVQPRYRPSFTLVELLVAISIIGIMAGMALYSLAGAQTDARVARTRSTISKLNEIVLQRWEEFRYRPINLNIDATWRLTNRVPGRDRARMRMLALRDAMRMELPDRVTDVIYRPSSYKAVSPTTGNVSFPFRPTPPAHLLHALAQRAYGMCVEAELGSPAAKEPWISGSFRGALNGDANTPYNVFFANLFPGFSSAGYAGSVTAGTVSSVSDREWQATVNSAELLYLICSTSNYNGSSALEFFRPSEVGDFDDDGLLEFVDAWDQPIQWIRWPAGYPGDLIKYAEPDAMDPVRTDWRYRPGIDEAWHPRTLVPLIVSAGQDGDFDLVFDFFGPNAISYQSDTAFDFGSNRPLGQVVFGTMAWPSSPAPPYGTTNNALYYGGNRNYGYPDPHFTWDPTSGSANGPGSGLPGAGANQLGAVFPGADGDDGSIDNITNHDIILEP